MGLLIVPEPATRAAAYLTDSLHGAGSPQAQRIMLARLANLEEKMRLARRLAGIAERPQQ